MEHFENVALSTAIIPPRMRRRYVDDTVTTFFLNIIDGLTDHINFIDPFTKFAGEPEVND